MGQKHHATDSATTQGTADVSPAAGGRARTDRLPPSRKPTGGERGTADLDGAREAIQRLGELADQLAAAIADRDFFRSRAIAGSIESLRRSMAPILASAARGGADPDALTALEASAKPMSARLDTLIPQAPERLPGLGIELDPAADAARETAWLASLQGAPSRSHKGDPFFVARFLDGAQSGGAVGGAVEPGAASVQPDHASGSIDEPLIDWQDAKRAALSGPFLAAPRGVQDVLGGPLLDLLRERETIHFLVDPTGGDPIKSTVADVLADLANDPIFTTAFAEGAITGTVRAVYDTLKGFHDAGKLIQEILVKLATFQHLELLKRGRKAIDDLMKLIGAAPGLLEDFADKWKSIDSYTRGQFQGEVVGYVLTQVAIIIAGSITGGPAIASPFANVIKVLGWIDNPIAGLAELAVDAKLSTTALEALRTGQGIRSIEPIAETRTAGRAFDAVGDAAKDLAATQRPLATADELVALRLAAYEEITAIAVVRVPEGAVPGVAHDTLYVSRADGARIPALLRAIKPDVEIRPYNKGLLVRDGASEWWLEFNDQAALVGTQRATGIGAMHGGIGLPEPNVATVELVGYRGVREIDGRTRDQWTAREAARVKEETDRRPLLGAGHVGVSFDGGKTVIGLTPEFGEMPLPDVKGALEANKVFPGVVGNDTAVFAIAEKLAAERGWNTEVVRSPILMGRAQQARILERVRGMQSMAPGEHGFGYSFPLKNPDGPHHFAGGTSELGDGQSFDADHVRNCAAFPQEVGVPIPEQSGSMRAYMPALEKWANNPDAPIDARPREPKL